LPEFREENGRTSVPLRFEPGQSYFVVFCKGQRQPGVNFSELKPTAELAGPWEVAFDPKWGGPKSVRFDVLVDWTKRPEEGVKYYSGTAIYTQTFKAPAAAGKNQRIYLDLGAVRAMARVKLNGKDLGVVWTPPFRVDITSAVTTGNNTLAISVVNLWPNRMIGDQLLPPDKRYTWSTWNPFKKDSPLLESGLLGPVRLLATERM